VQVLLKRKRGKENKGKGWKKKKGKGKYPGVEGTGNDEYKETEG